MKNKIQIIEQRMRRLEQLYKILAAQKKAEALKAKLRRRRGVNDGR